MRAVSLSFVFKVSSSTSIDALLSSSLVTELFFKSETVCSITSTRLLLPFDESRRSFSVSSSSARLITTALVPSSITLSAEFPVNSKTYLQSLEKPNTRTFSAFFAPNTSSRVFSHSNVLWSGTISITGRLLSASSPAIFKVSVLLPLPLFPRINLNISSLP
ncbi:unknown [Ruminococcus sp. CAG:108]|nr:unknown [Ruminococcus sp. CAG:108]